MNTVHEPSRSRFKLYSTLLYQMQTPAGLQIRSLGKWLEPRYIIGAKALDQ